MSGIHGLEKTAVARKILVAHQKTDVLDHFEKALRELSGGEWEAEFVASGEKVLQLLETGSCEVVASGFGISDMTGGELLEKVMARFPETVRILISDPEDLDRFLSTVGPAHQFLRENCESDELGTTLDRAVRVRDLLDDPGLRSLVSRMTTLPSLPSLYTDIVRELRSDEPSIARIARTIANDVSMATKVLQLVNSVAFGARVKISDPVRASVYLGLDMLKALVLSAKVFAQFDKMQLAMLTVGELWDHSMYVAALARRIACSERPDDKDLIEEAFLAGVLHDVGKLVLAANLPQGYIHAIDLARESGISMTEAESIVFGATHADIGAYLVGLWGLSDEMVAAAQHHHYPSRAARTDFSAITAVHAANALDHERVRDPEDDDEDTLFDREHLARIGAEERLGDWRSLRGR